MDGHFLQGTFNGRLRPNDERPDVSCGGISGVSALRSFETWKAAMTPNGGEVMGADW
jgi:hypothetical protein